MLAADFGFLKEHIDLAKYTDLAIMEDAVKRVGAALNSAATPSTTGAARRWSPTAAPWS